MRRAACVTTTRIDDYQGPETYCPATGSCITRDIVLSTADGYDDMTGLGTPGLGFVPALGRAGPDVTGSVRGRSTPPSGRRHGHRRGRLDNVALL